MEWWWEGAVSWAYAQHTGIQAEMVSLLDSRTAGLFYDEFQTRRGCFWCGCGVVKRYVYVVSSLYDTLIHAF